MSLLDGFFSLGADDNKVSESDSIEGAVGTLLPELELPMEDSELIELKRSWIKEWNPYEAEIKKVQDLIEQYWLGSQSGVSDKDTVDNIIFEVTETFLPIATRPKAEPIVESDNTDEGNALADKTRKMISYVADNGTYNLKLKQVARYWALYLLGVMKVGWSAKNNDISFAALRPQKLILQPKATIEECEYKGYYIGEYIDDVASDLIARFPKKEQFISDKCAGKMGTTVQYIMWTTDDYTFWTLDDEILSKIKNPHWNYDQQVTPQPTTDEFGNPVEQPSQKIEGKNHFKSPKKPYVFLSIFSIGKRPHDATSLILQALPIQDLVNKRLQQIDRNADHANSSVVISGDVFTEEQADTFAKRRRKGAALYVPSGAPSDAVMDLPATALPNFVYESLQDYRNELRNIFGTRGSSPQGTMREHTLGGKQLIQGQDTDRIGGGISTFLEQFSDKVFNWFVQLMYVYYDEPHMASVIGEERAKEYIQLTNDEFIKDLTVGVKEGSMVPHDPASKREEAIELWKDHGIDPITFFDRLEFPNPRETAKALYLWNADPIQLFPDLLQQQQQQQAQQNNVADLQQQQQQLQQQDQVAQEQDIAHQRELEKIALQTQAKQV